MKILKYILLGIVLFLWFFYVIPAGLLQVPYIQGKLSEKASAILRKKLGVEVTIGKVNFDLLNKLTLKDVYLEDLSGDTLFSAGRLSAGFEFIPLLKGHFQFDIIQLFDFRIQLNRATPDAPLNLQFLLDAFAGKDTTDQPKDISLRIQTVNLRRGELTYCVKNAKVTTEKFNPNDIHVRELSANIHIHSFTNDELNADLSRVSFLEKSGLNVQRIAFDITSTNRKTTVKSLELKLPNSLLALQDVLILYPNTIASTNLLKEAYINLKVGTSYVQLNDLAVFAPAFKPFGNRLTFDGDLSGDSDHLQFTNFHIREKDQLIIRATASLEKITDPTRFFIRGNIEQSFISSANIQQLVDNFSNKSVNLPSQITHMGDIGFEGELSGLLQNLTAYGIITTDIGTLRTDINIGRRKHLYVNGSITSNGMDIRKLMNDSDYGNASFNINVDAEQDDRQLFSGKIDATVGRFEYKNYSYEDIALNGVFTPSSFSGTLSVDNPDGYLAARGLFVMQGERSEFDFSAEARRVKLDRLNLSKKYKNSNLSFDINANFTGNSIDNLVGAINLTDMTFNTERGSYALDTFNLNVSQLETEKLLTVHSNLLNGEIRGIYSLTGINTSINQTLAAYLPSVFPTPQKPVDVAPNSFSIHFTIEDLQKSSYILDLPFTTFGQSTISGQYNSIYDKFYINIHSDRFAFKNAIVESGTILLENPKDSIRLNISGISLQKNDMRMKFRCLATINEDLVCTRLDWDDNDDRQYAGALAFNTLFERSEPNGDLSTRINILPTDITVNDSVWSVLPASVTIDSTTLRVRKLRIEHKDQFIQVEGTVAPNPSDSLIVSLNRMNLEYIFNTLNIPALEFKGNATGYIKLRDVYETREMSTNLDVRDFTFNNTVFGRLSLNGLWDEQLQGILMRGNIFKNDTTTVGVDGVIYPVKEELSILFDAKNADASFLRKYMNKVAKNVSGELTGKMRLFGDLNNPTIEGDVFVRNGRFGIDFLNTYYTFSDTVRCRPNEITVQDMNLYDKNGLAATVKQAYVRHQQFDDFAYNANLVFDNFHVFNATEALNPFFYGTVYGTGNATIYGTENSVNIDVSMQNTRNTQLTLNFMQESDISNHDFIRFVDKRKDTTSLLEKYHSLLDEKPIYINTGDDTDVRFKLSLEATPDAQVDLIMDPTSGDKIRMYGNGHLEMEYGTRVPLRMTGNYTIERGKYNFSFQQVIFRDFDIQEGSTVSFHGDPYAANIAINAVYTTTTNLSDLNPDLVNYAGRSSVPVNCILNITGALEHPNINFNIEVPESDYLERQIKNYINTDDMMNRQIVYLLVLNRFYTSPEYTTTGFSRSINDFSSIASSTLSSSLSGIIGSFTDNVQLGTRIRATDEVAMTGNEVELMLSSQLLDNRLIFNGNLGYRDYSRLTGIETELPPFIGDFDLEYRLSPRGNTWLKFYSHYNYRYYYEHQAKTTQGLGIIYRKNFERLDELFGKNRTR